jgi:hypothetical protein
MKFTPSMAELAKALFNHGECSLNLSKRYIFSSFVEFQFTGVKGVNL